MPRRRNHHHHHRLEWTNSMQSHITLVDQPLHQIHSQPASAPATTSVPGIETTMPSTRLRGISAAAASTFGADNFAADIRPVQIRASSQPQQFAANATRATRTRTLPLPSNNTSSATTTTTALGRNADSARDTNKTHINFVRRAKETLKRQLRSLGHSIRHLPDGSISAESYYHSVSLN
ncbi:hypothetical protein FB639_003152 [Coemansia asiatica]|nr:hypothetical protein FB639_003152 [Coemansia asiatica]